MLRSSRPRQTERRSSQQAVSSRPRCLLLLASAAPQKPPRRATLKAELSVSHTLASPQHRLAEFLESASGHTVCLALDDWQWQRLNDCTYRCLAESYSFLGHDVQPALDLAVTVHRAESECRILLLQASLEGSASVQQQSRRFVPSASHVIRLTGRELRSHVTLQARSLFACGATKCRSLTALPQVELELFGGPLALLPTTAVSAPGSLVLQRMIARNLKPFHAKLEAAYLEWEAAAAVPDDAALEPVPS